MWSGEAGWGSPLTINISSRNEGRGMRDAPISSCHLRPQKALLLSRVINNNKMWAKFYRFYQRVGIDTRKPLFISNYSFTCLSSPVTLQRIGTNSFIFDATKMWMNSFYIFGCKINVWYLQISTLLMVVAAKYQVVNIWLISNAS